MKLLSYTVEGNLRSLQPITHFKIHHWKSGTRHLVFWKLSVLWSRTKFCEYCETETGIEDVCPDCFEHHFCECGQELTDSYGSPGDGFCRRCD